MNDLKGLQLVRLALGALPPWLQMGSTASKKAKRASFVTARSGAHTVFEPAHR